MNGEFKRILKYYFLKEKKINIISSLRRSGWNYTEAVLNSAFCLKIGIPSKIIFNEDRYYSYFSCSKPLDYRGIFKPNTEQYLFHTHQPYENITTNLKKDANIVVLCRNPLDFIKSSIVKHLISKNKFKENLNLSEFLEIDNEKKFIKYFNNFIKSWLNKSDKLKVIYFENNQIKENPFNYFKKINNHFNFGFNDDQIIKSIDECTIENQKKNMSEKSIRVSNVNLTFEDELVKFINTNCHQNWKNYMNLIAS